MENSESLFPFGSMDDLGLTLSPGSQSLFHFESELDSALDFDLDNVDFNEASFAAFAKFEEGKVTRKRSFSEASLNKTVNETPLKRQNLEDGVGINSAGCPEGRKDTGVAIRQGSPGNDHQPEFTEQTDLDPDSEFAPTTSASDVSCKTSCNPQCECEGPNREYLSESQGSDLEESSHESANNLAGNPLGEPPITPASGSLHGCPSHCLSETSCPDKQIQLNTSHLKSSSLPDSPNSGLLSSTPPPLVSQPVSHPPCTSSRKSSFSSQPPPAPHLSQDTQPTLLSSSTSTIMASSRVSPAQQRHWYLEQQAFNNRVMPGKMPGTPMTSTYASPYNPSYGCPLTPAPTSGNTASEQALRQQLQSCEQWVKSVVAERDKYRNELARLTSVDKNGKLGIETLRSELSTSRRLASTRQSFVSNLRKESAEWEAKFKELAHKYNNLVGSHQSLQATVQASANFRDELSWYQKFEQMTSMYNALVVQYHNLLDTTRKQPQNNGSCGIPSSVNCSPSPGSTPGRYSNLPQVTLPDMPGTLSASAMQPAPQLAKSANMTSAPQGLQAPHNVQVPQSAQAVQQAVQPPIKHTSASELLRSRSRNFSNIQPVSPPGSIQTSQSPQVRPSIQARQYFQARQNLQDAQALQAAQFQPVTPQAPQFVDLTEDSPSVSNGTATANSNPSPNSNSGLTEFRRNFRKKPLDWLRDPVSPTNPSGLSSALGMPLGTRPIRPVRMSSTPNGCPNSEESPLSEAEIVALMEQSLSESVQAINGIESPINTTPDSQIAAMMDESFANNVQTTDDTINPANIISSANNTSAVNVSSANIAGWKGANTGENLQELTGLTSPTSALAGFDFDVLIEEAYMENEQAANQAKVPVDEIAAMIAGGSVEENGEIVIETTGSAKPAHVDDIPAMIGNSVEKNVQAMNGILSPANTIPDTYNAALVGDSVAEKSDNADKDLDMDGAGDDQVVGDADVIMDDGLDYLFEG